jgi:hypothetical protein
MDSRFNSRLETNLKYLFVCITNVTGSAGSIDGVHAEIDPRAAILVLTLPRDKPPWI